jgi:hypothetical protein
MKLFGDQLAHAMHLVAVAQTDLLILGKVIFDALARQVCRQPPATTLLPSRGFGVRQSRVRQINAIRLVAALIVP